MSTDTPESYHCSSCGRFRRHWELKAIGPKGDPLLVCPTCDVPVTRESDDDDRRPYLIELAKAFLFPFRPMTALTAVGVSLFATLAGYSPFVPSILEAAILVAYWFAVVRSTSAGEDDLNTSPEEIGPLATWIGPLLRYLCALVVAFGPAAAAAYWLPEPTGGVVALIAAALGTVYLPAALLVAAHDSGCLGVLNPAPAVKLIASIPGPYFLTLGMLLVVAAVGAPLFLLAAELSENGTTFLQQIAVGLLTMLPFLVMARMLGLLVREHA